MKMYNIYYIYIYIYICHSGGGGRGDSYFAGRPGREPRACHSGGDSRRRERKRVGRVCWWLVGVVALSSGRGACDRVESAYNRVDFCRRRGKKGADLVLPVVGTRVRCVAKRALFVRRRGRGAEREREPPGATHTRLSCSTARGWDVAHAARVHARLRGRDLSRARRRCAASPVTRRGGGDVGWADARRHDEVVLDDERRLLGVHHKTLDHTAWREKAQTFFHRLSGVNMTGGSVTSVHVMVATLLDRRVRIAHVTGRR